MCVRASYLADRSLLGGQLLTLAPAAGQQHLLLVWCALCVDHCRWMCILTRRDACGAQDAEQNAWLLGY